MCVITQYIVHNLHLETTECRPLPVPDYGMKAYKRPGVKGGGHYATSREVAGSSPDEVILFFNSPNPSSRTMTLGSTQPLTEMSIRNLPGLSTLWAFTACYWIALPFISDMGH
jgi:hypothetical protein